MKQKKEITEQTAFSLVQFYAVVLFECNEAEDYGPAMTLMNTAFTFHHEGEYVDIYILIDLDSTRIQVDTLGHTPTPF